MPCIADEMNEERILEDLVKRAGMGPLPKDRILQDDGFQV